MATQCIVHDEADTVGVVVVEGHREFVLTRLYQSA
jgi:hypothetical protein